jgi:hypothetical protein
MTKRVSITRSEATPHHFVAPFNDGGYVLLLVISDPAVSPNAQRQLSSAIVRTGCRYALAFGVACSTWDDSIDLASIEAHVPDDRFIMTTWHEKEPIEDVVDFWWWNTVFDDFVPERFGVFHIGSDSELERRIEGRIRHHQSKEAEPSDGPNEEERGQPHVSIERQRRAPPHRSS